MAIKKIILENNAEICCGEGGCIFFVKTFPRLCNSVEIHNKFYDIASVEIWYTIINLAYQTSKSVFTQ